MVARLFAALVLIATGILSVGCASPDAPPPAPSDQAVSPDEGAPVTGGALFNGN